MPELPEAETWRRALAHWLGGQTLVGVEVLEPTSIRPRLSTRPSDAMANGTGWLKGHVGLRFDGFHRIGKRLGLSLGDASWLVHLGMSGRFDRGDAPKSARIGLVLGDGSTVWFCDQRRFGCIAPQTGPLAAGLGPDALVSLTGPQLHARFPGRRAVKVALLDQACLAGLGNIHAAEALWRAGIAPNTPCDRATPEQWTRLASAIPAQLNAALDAIPAIEDFVYLTDGGENPFAVYDREDQACPRCQEAVQRQVQGGRSTYWCPGCQPAS